MRFASINPCTLLDYPDKIAAILFTAGCNFRCGYCHNPSFVDPEKITHLSKTFLSEEVILNFLKTRQGLLEGVVLCGGEPTIHADLEEFIHKVRSLGFLIKLDTNGSNPSVLAHLLSAQLIDYVAMDIKSSETHYQDITGSKIKVARIKESISLLKQHTVPYEYRTTILPEYHSLSELILIGQMIQGAPLWALQQCRTEHTLDPTFSQKKNYTTYEMIRLQEALKGSVEQIIVR